MPVSLFAKASEAKCSLCDLDTALEVWPALEARCPTRMIFSSAEFLALWYRHYASVYGEPRFMLIEEAAGIPLAGAAWVKRRTRYGGVPVSRLDLAGYEGASGELLVAEDDSNGHVAALLAQGLARQDDWDLAEIENVPTQAAWREPFLQAARAAGLRVAQRPSAYAYVDLRSGAEAHWRTFDGKRRRNLKRALERGARTGSIAVTGLRFFDPTSWVDRETVLERAFALTDANPKLRAAGRRISTYHREFYRALAEHYVPRGQFDLAILTIDGKDAAFVMALVERGIYYDVTVSYHEAFRCAFPGINLMYRLIEELAGHGVQTVVSPGAYDYKRHWASGFHSVWTLRLERCHARMRLARLGRRVREALGPREPRAIPLDDD